MADLLTKNLCESEIVKYIGLLQLRFSECVVAKAAQLHSLDISKVKLTGHGWDNVCKTRILRRRHMTRRRCMFASMKVHGVSRQGDELTGRRVAEGERRNGTTFALADDWH